MVADRRATSLCGRAGEARRQPVAPTLAHSGFPCRAAAAVDKQRRGPAAARAHLQGGTALSLGTLCCGARLAVALSALGQLGLLCQLALHSRGQLALVRQLSLGQGGRMGGRHRRKRRGCQGANQW